MATQKRQCHLHISYEYVTLDVIVNAVHVPYQYRFIYKHFVYFYKQPMVMYCPYRRKT